MKIILIGNYPPDKQQSMKRFATMLQDGYRSNGIVADIWLPTVLFGRLTKSTGSGLGKWLGYIDKWILFPVILRFRVFTDRKNRNVLRFHICDHSNAPYLSHMPIDKTVVTCHDVLAIRGSLGFKDAYCEASAFGKLLQKWILTSLSRATKIASVSIFTESQLKDLVKDKKTNQLNWKVIYNGFNAPFKKLSSEESRLYIKDSGLPLDVPFILHVGSNLPRKNRKLILDMAASLGDNWQGNICFAGQALEEKLVNYAAALNLSQRIFSVANIDHDTLIALYSQCVAFVFPSYSEGFGWPLIEAQACEAPVLASNVQPMPEVSGGAALHADPDDAVSFGKALLALQDIKIKEKLIEDGLVNCKRFDTATMIQAYIHLHSI